MMVEITRKLSSQGYPAEPANGCDVGIGTDELIAGPTGRRGRRSILPPSAWPQQLAGMSGRAAGK
jgi:hypothetical protein